MALEYAKMLPSCHQNTVAISFGITTPAESTWNPSLTRVWRRLESGTEGGGFQTKAF